MACHPGELQPTRFAALRYRVGSYTPLEKWLKDRRGRILSGDDRRHYETFATAIGKVRAELLGAEEVWQLIRSGNWFNPLE